MQPIEKLKILIKEELNTLDEYALPYVATLIRTPSGKQKVEQWIIRLAEKEGMSVGSSLAQIENELA